MMRNRPSAAHHSLSRLRGLDDSSPYFEREFDELKSRFDVNADSQSALQSLKSLLGSCITDPPTRKLLLFVTIIQTFFIMSGGNSITYYAPTILKSIGLNSQQRLLFSAIYGMIKFASVFLYAFVLTTASVVDHFCSLGPRSMSFACAIWPFISVLPISQDQAIPQQPPGLPLLQSVSSPSAMDLAGRLLSP